MLTKCVRLPNFGRRKQAGGAAGRRQRVLVLWRSGEDLNSAACTADGSCARRRSITEGGDTFYTDWEETFAPLNQMGLHENLLRGIYACAPPLLRTHC